MSSTLYLHILLRSSTDPPQLGYSLSTDPLQPVHIRFVVYLRLGVSVLAVCPHCFHNSCTVPLQLLFSASSVPAQLFCRSSAYPAQPKCSVPALLYPPSQPNISSAASAHRLSFEVMCCSPAGPWQFLRSPSTCPLRIFCSTCVASAHFQHIRYRSSERHEQFLVMFPAFPFHFLCRSPTAFPRNSLLLLDSRFAAPLQIFSDPSHVLCISFAYHFHILCIFSAAPRQFLGSSSAIHIPHMLDSFPQLSCRFPAADIQLFVFLLVYAAVCSSEYFILHIASS